MSSLNSFLESISPQQLFDDPYPVYERLRKEAPVAYIPQLRTYWITRYDDVAKVVAEEDGWATSTGVEGHPLRRTLGDPVITMVGGETHDDLRIGVDKTLRPRSISAVSEEMIRPIARARAKALVDRREGDLVTEYFEPVSVEALRHVLGLHPYVEAEQLVSWFKQLARGAGNFAQDPAVYGETDAVAREIEEILLPVLDELSNQPESETMLSQMLWAGRQDGTPRSVNHILSTVKIILLGGMQEPGHAASSSAYGLFESGQWGLLREDPTKWVPNAIINGLRWIAPIGVTGRAPARDLEFHGVSIPQGHHVEGVLASANRDEAKYSLSHQFDIERNEKAHQAFGGGQHFCAGHFFGRQVERVMFEELLAATKDISLKPGADVPVVGWVFRAPRSMSVTLQAA